MNKRYTEEQIIGFLRETLLRTATSAIEGTCPGECHTHPQLQREVCGGDFEGELRHADFGARFGMPFVGNRVRLRVQVEGIRQSRGAG